VITKLDAPLKRELRILGQTYTLTISADGLHLAPKGRRKGQELRWADLVSGDAALATALNASLARAGAPHRLPARAPAGNAAGKAKHAPRAATTRSRRKGGR